MSPEGIHSIESEDPGFKPVLPYIDKIRGPLRLTVEVGGRVVGAGIGLYIATLFPDQRENTTTILLSVLAGYMLLNIATHCVTDRIWGREEYIPWYKRLMEW